ncbi:primosomal protein N' [uncultured Corynebacterium sp.]|uniref:primosomal protein N' n=1 Tax=uncultured Corynebacterium sp. TaxID=159447 RepID=UPI0025E01CB1|nr:primosomal protein N' [uncultured Corynebacterium sp.]
MNEELEQPIARVLPLLGVPHLDRLFDYSVPAKFNEEARAGVRVRVRFAGRLVDALLIERRSTTDHEGELRPLERVISPLQLLTPQLWDAVNVLAERWAGTRSDILRSVLPARHASAEKAGLFGGGKSWDQLGVASSSWEELTVDSLQAAKESLGLYRFGTNFLDATLASRRAHAHLLGIPGHNLHQMAADVASTVAMHGQGVLIVAPNAREIGRITSALSKWLSATQITELSAEIGPSARYRRYLSILAGQARVVVGTRSAMLAPVQNLGLIVLFGETDDNLVDPRAPYLHARDVLRLQAEQAGASMMVVGVHRSAEIQQWIEEGFMHAVLPEPEHMRARRPWIRALADSDTTIERELHAPGSRLPTMGFEAIRRALDAGRPVLVHVPRRGYAPSISCSHCRAPARCRSCNGPLELPGAGEDGTPQSPRCRWCGASAGVFSCPECGHRGLKLNIVGQDRTAQELGRAFPGTRIISSAGDRVLSDVANEPAIVVATPGAEPHVKGGLYGAAIIMDPWVQLGRPDLRATEKTLRHWLEVAALVAPHGDGGVVVVVAEAWLRPVQDLIKWDAPGAARAELASRKDAAFPPAVTMAAIDGTRESIDQLLAVWERPEGTDLLGPVELPPGIRLPSGLTPIQSDQARRLIVRVPASATMQLGHSLKVAQSIRAAQRNTGPLRVVMNPVRVG